MIKTLMKTFVRWLRSEEGPTSVEYAVMLMLIVAAAITAIQLFGETLGGSLQDSSDKIHNAIGGG
jgi:pilus assembly protein Flp/PilA